MQSGISASKELHTAFQTLLSTPSQRGLLAGISSSPEALVPTQTVPSTSPDFSADLVNLQSLVSDNAASYIILRQDGKGQGGSGTYVAITYVPDRAPVRQKMLFASTRLTLIRELGTEHFGQTLFATLPSELTADGWANHEAHGSLAAPLTEEEQNLVGIREAEAQESMGTSSRGGGHVHRGVLSVDSAAKEALEKLGKADLALVQLEIDMKTEGLALASTDTMPLSPADLPAKISSDSPRYSFYAYTQASPPKILFIYTNPASPKINIKARMLYAASRRSTEVVVAPDHGITLAGKLEAGDPSDITEAEVLEALGVTTSGQGTNGQGNGATAASAGTLGRGGGFARPKRPGR